MIGMVIGLQGLFGDRIWVSELGSLTNTKVIRTTAIESRLRAPGGLANLPGGKSAGDSIPETRAFWKLFIPLFQASLLKRKFNSGNRSLLSQIDSNAVVLVVYVKSLSQPVTGPNAEVLGRC
jgi:hypothetical protein